MPSGRQSAGRGRRRVRVIHYCSWADSLQPAAEFLAALPAADLRARVTAPDDPKALAMARLDRDWHAENVRVFAAMNHPDIEFLEAWVVGATGMQHLVGLSVPAGEDWWVIFIGQQPQHLAKVAGSLFGFLRRRGMRILHYAYDEASRTMPCFAAIAPQLDVLIHDESPLAEEGARLLRPDCLQIHRSWVANVEPFAQPFMSNPEPRILFLGSEMGFTPHRRRQVEFLTREFGDRLVAIHDHSVSVETRAEFASRFLVSLCPEGRKFSTPAMAGSHTDRPFWSGCLGMVPVAEDSQSGGRLEALHRAGLIIRYPHGDLAALRAACGKALAATTEERRRTYNHFNGRETVGIVVADQIAAAQARVGALSSVA
ncbi:MAG TPA: hypothetical protein VGM73_04795 [Candidatus Didemnitutus sp.]